MKKLVVAVACALMCCATLTSCDEILNSFMTPMDSPSTNGGLEIPYGWSEEDNHLYYRVNENAQCDVLWDFVMEEELCKEAIINYQFASILLANLYYEALQADEEFSYDYSISANLIIVDMTPDFVGRSIEQIKSVFESAEDETNPDNDDTNEDGNEV